MSKSTSILGRSYDPSGHRRWHDGSAAAIAIDAMSKGANQVIAAEAAGISPALLGVWLRTGAKLNTDYIAQQDDDPVTPGDLANTLDASHTEQLQWMLWKDVHRAKATRAIEVLDKLVEHGDRDWRAAVAWLDRTYPQQQAQHQERVPLDVSAGVVSALDRVAQALAPQLEPADDDITDVEVIEDTVPLLIGVEDESDAA